MTEQPPSPPPGRTTATTVPGTAVLGAILVVAGLVFLIGQAVDVPWGGEMWPFYVIGGGVILAALGLSQPANSGLTVAGSIVAVVGALLLYQEWADHYESWAYAWPLVAPGGSGLGMLLHGARHGNAKMARDGFWQIVTALGIFVVGLVFFEGIIGLSGDRWNLPEWVLPAVVIGVGVLILVRALTSGRDDQPA
jgi:hypothetical protein